MASNEVGPFVKPDRIPSFVSILRSMRVATLIKEALSVHIIENKDKKYDVGPGFFGMGVGFTLEEIGYKKRNKVKPYFHVHKVEHEFPLPMTSSECMAQFSSKMVGFEREIDQRFYTALAWEIPKESIIETAIIDQFKNKILARCSQAVSDQKIRPAMAYVKPMTDVETPLRVFEPGYKWFLDENGVVVAADKQDAGMLLTSPTGIELEVKKDKVILRLSKRMGLLVNPRAFSIGLGGRK